MILRAYIDDSDIGNNPVAVLAGWLGPAERWATFSEEWDKALRWKRLKRFKMDEFLGRSGEFHGWDESDRTQFIKYLMNIIRERAFKGIGVTLSGQKYSNVFGKTLSRKWDVPYSLMLFQLVSNTVQRFDYNDLERIDFVFDEQPGQIGHIYEEWDKFKRLAPERLQGRIGDIVFRSDERVLPLQAADMYAGWIRRIVPSLEAGETPPEAPWSGQEPTLDSFTDYMTEEGLRLCYNLLSGRGQSA